MKQYDIIVIGSGGGMKIAGPAADKGYSVALIERDAMGGTCLNRGCIPSKMVIYPADIIHAMRHAHHIDILHEGNPKIAFQSLIQRVSETVDGMSKHIETKVPDHPNIDLIRGHAEFLDDKTLSIDGKKISGKMIFIAVGSEPFIPKIQGLEGTPYLTSREALRNTTLPERMIVIGAGYIACELGHAYSAFGTETHFVVRSKVLRHEDDDIQQEFEREFAKHHQLHQGTPHSVSYKDGAFTLDIGTPDGTVQETITADALLVAAGVQPSTHSLGLQNTSMRMDSDGFIQVDDCLWTGVDGIYALGDCVGNYLFRHSVNREGDYLVKMLFESRNREPIAYGPMPHAVFTIPEIAGAGLTERELQKQNIDYICGKATYADSNMGLARQLDYGFVKLLIDKQTRKILGAHIIGEEASDMIHMLIALMYQDATLDALLDMVYIHPALPEIVRDAARDATSRM